MFSAEVEPAWSFEAWRALARAGWCAQVEPDDVAWNGGAQGGLLMGQGLLAMPAVVPPPRVSADFMQLAASVLCHRDPQRHAVLYRLLWRVASGKKPCWNAPPMWMCTGYGNGKKRCSAIPTK